MELRPKLGFEGRRLVPTEIQQDATRFESVSPECHEQFDSVGFSAGGRDRNQLNVQAFFRSDSAADRDDEIK